MIVACCIAALPPTSRPPLDAPLTVAPGISTPAAAMLRAIGMVSSTSRVITRRCDPTFCTSTRGDDPETVIVSSTAPTRISTLTFAVKFSPSSTPSRRTVLKPGSEKVTVYTPVVRLMI